MSNVNNCIFFFFFFFASKVNIGIVSRVFGLLLAYVTCITIIVCSVMLNKIFQVKKKIIIIVVIIIAVSFSCRRREVKKQTIHIMG